ncbi:NmrA family protein [Lentinula aff. detonsa]|uniref:NmrA family protein n=1 Tax=Lentinula aff. detonsa TaxID=2804958 RepID=A0AA38KAU6_9AGAR|nr:NmrA family protein [Lentinula aff. detonsa]
MNEDMKEILVIGGTGAQGRMVVKVLAQSKRYHVRILTRNSRSSSAQHLASLPNVTLMEGRQDNQKDLHRAFQGVYGAWVNTDGFSLNEKDELFYGIRAYEIAQQEHVQHYIWASLPYTLKYGNWDEKYYAVHANSKGRIRDFVLAQGQEGMKSSILTTVPYMEMFLDGMFVPKEQTDGSFVWRNPATTGRIPLIALEDVGHYSLWLFDNIPESAGLDLKIATDYVTFADIVNTFTRVTHKKGIHKSLSLEEYLPLAEPFPNAPINWYAGPDVARDESTRSWRESISGFWRYWNEELDGFANMDLLDRIHPNRIKSLEEWMRKVGYDGHMKPIMKGPEGLRREKMRSKRESKL